MDNTPVFMTRELTQLLAASAFRCRAPDIASTSERATQLAGVCLRVCVTLALNVMHGHGRQTRHLGVITVLLFYLLVLDVWVQIKCAFNKKEMCSSKSNWSQLYIKKQISIFI